MPSVECQCHASSSVVSLISQVKTLPMLLDRSRSCTSTELLYSSSYHDHHVYLLYYYHPTQANSNTGVSGFHATLISLLSKTSTFSVDLHSLASTTAAINRTTHWLSSASACMLIDQLCRAISPLPWFWSIFADTFPNPHAFHSRPTPIDSPCPPLSIHGTHQSVRRVLPKSHDFL